MTRKNQRAGPEQGPALVVSIRYDWTRTRSSLEGVPGGRLHLHHSDLVHAAAGYPDVAVLVRHHVAHHAAARRDSPTLELLGLGVEAHDGVRPDARLVVP